MGEVHNVSKIISDIANIYAISRTQNKMYVYDRNTLALADEENLNEKPVDAIMYQGKIYILCAKEGVLEVSKLIGAVRINQNVLKTLGVSCEAIDEIVQLAEQHHFAAKLTGGGGEGCVVAIRETACDEDEAALINVLHSRGYQTCVVRLGGEGINLEQIESTV